MLSALFLYLYFGSALTVIGQDMDNQALSLLAELQATNRHDDPLTTRLLLPSLRVSGLVLRVVS